MELIFTLFGLNGYFSYKYKTFYIIGEWFTDAIEIIYCLYPIIMQIFNKNNLLFPIFLFFGFIIIAKTKYFEICIYNNLIS